MHFQKYLNAWLFLPCSPHQCCSTSKGRCSSECRWAVLLLTSCSEMHMELFINLWFTQECIRCSLSRCNWEWLDGASLGSLWGRPELLHSSDPFIVLACANCGFLCCTVDLEHWHCQEGEANIHHMYPIMEWAWPNSSSILLWQALVRVKLLPHLAQLQSIEVCIFAWLAARLVITFIISHIIPINSPPPHPYHQ